MRVTDVRLGGGGVPTSPGRYEIVDAGASRCSVGIVEIVTDDRGRLSWQDGERSRHISYDMEGTLTREAIEITWRAVDGPELTRWERVTKDTERLRMPGAWTYRVRHEVSLEENKNRPTGYTWTVYDEPASGSHGYANLWRGKWFRPGLASGSSGVWRWWNQASQSSGVYESARWFDPSKESGPASWWQYVGPIEEPPELAPLPSLPEGWAWVQASEGGSQFSAESEHCLVQWTDDGLWISDPLQRDTDECPPPEVIRAMVDLLDIEKRREP